MKDIYISETVRYIGADDMSLDLFESQYRVPDGVSYNSYVILDEKTAVMDTVDERKTEEWFKNLREALAGRDADYLVISHLEPDHAANIGRFAEAYPNARFVLSAKAKAMLPQFFDIADLDGRCVVVKEGDVLELGAHRLTFIMASMVHWPEVMVEYESTEKILFSADAFGKFGAIGAGGDWIDEARRYFLNIVGKYGVQVQTLLKKAAALDIRTICPLHGPILKENLDFYIGKYSTWSSYEPEEDGVLIACASIHGHTAAAAEKMEEILRERGANVLLTDLARDDMAKAVSDAFRYGKMILAAASYDGGIFPPMEDFLHRLVHKNFRNRTVGLMENGSWAPCAARQMAAALADCKNVSVCETVVSIRSAMRETDVVQMERLAEEILTK